MIEYHKVVNVPYSPSQMFNLVTDIVKYREFLTWCNHSEILKTLEQGVLAELGIHYKGFSVQFQTRNTYISNQQIDIELANKNGPLKKLKGTWKFTPINQNDGCQIDFQISISVGLIFSFPLKKILTFIASSLIDDFIKRAHYLYANDYTGN